MVCLRCLQYKIQWEDAIIAEKSQNKESKNMLKNPEKTKKEIVQWIRDYFAANGPSCDAVIGI